VERQSLRRLLPDSGEVFQFVDKAFHRSGKIRHS
jgi:hypothetical protein